MKKFKKIYIEITNICNLRCSFCPQDNLKKQEMPLEQFEHILKQIDNYTDYLYLHIKGEPLLHSKFKDILLLAKKYNKKVNITTNGTLLKKQLNNILESGIVRQINISLQSIIDINVLDEILTSSSLLAHENIQIVYRMWAINNETIINKLQEKYQFTLAKDVKLDNNLYLNFEHAFIWPSLDLNESDENGTCYGLRTHLGILVDGSIVPCCLDSKGIINLGNIFSTSFEDILNSERVKTIITGFQNNKVTEELCSKCDYKKRFKKTKN